jgi:hypothetical protein
MLVPEVAAHTVPPNNRYYATKVVNIDPDTHGEPHMKTAEYEHGVLRASVLYVSENSVSSSEDKGLLRA